MNKRKVYEGKILSLSLYSLPIRGKRVIREVVEHRGAAAVLAITDGKVILVKQYRFPYGYVLEIPAGTLEEGESPISCAFRELKEETGYQATKMTPLIRYYPSIGYNTEIICCFIASGAKKTSKRKLDQDEIMSVVKMDFKKVQKMILSGKIVDSKTICAVLTYALKKNIML